MTQKIAIISQHGMKEKPDCFCRPHQPGIKRNYIDQKAIMGVVNAVEEKKRFVKDPNLIIRHIVEEVGELSRAHYVWSQSVGKGGPDAWMVAKECVDIISLCVYLSEVLEMDLEKVFPIRLKEVMDQYGVKNDYV